VAYRLYRSTDYDYNYQLLTTTTDTFFNDFTVYEGMRYWYGVCGVGDDDSISAMEEHATSGFTSVPAQYWIPSVTATPMAPGSISVDWSITPSGADAEYAVRRESAGDWAWIGVTFAPTRTIIDTTATPGTSYWYEIVPWFYLGGDTLQGAAWGGPSNSVTAP
jgi:fibronectin type 3 domain-containing protein